MLDLDKILEIPGNKVVYESLKKRLENDEVFAFVGAGASSPLYPLWSGLIKQLSDKTLERGYIPPETHDFWIKESIKKPMYVAQLIKHSLGESSYKQALAEIFEVQIGDEGNRFTPTHEALMQIPFTGYVTTNYDPGLLNARSKYHPTASPTGFGTWSDSYFVKNWLTREIFKTKKYPVLYAHGLYDRSETLVLSQDEYEKAYTNPLYLETFKSLWTQHYLVFIGFGFSDPYLDYIATKQINNTTAQAAGEPRHIAILGLDTEYSPSIRSIYINQYNAEPLFYPIVQSKEEKSDRRALLTILKSLIKITNGNLTQPVNGEEVNNDAKVLISISNPHDLPSSEAILVGRDKEIEKIHEIFHGKQCLFITGIDGVGKSELALAYAKKYKQNYCGGSIWINVSDDIEEKIIEYAKNNFFSEFQGKKVTLKSCLKKWTPKKEPVLIIVDDLENIADIKYFLDSTTNETRFKFLITFQQSQTFAYSAVKLQPSDTISQKIIENILNSVRDRPDIKRDWSKLKILCERLGHLPLAVLLVGRILEQEWATSVDDILKEFEEDGLTAEFIRDRDPSTVAGKGIKAAFEVTWQRLSEKTRRLGIYLSLFAGAPFPSALLRDFPSYNGIDLKITISLEELQKFYLVKCTDIENRFYQMYSMMYDFIRDEKSNKYQDICNLKKQACWAIITAIQEFPVDKSNDFFQKRDLIRPHIKSVMANCSNEFPRELSSQVINARREIGLIYYDEGDYTLALTHLKISRRDNHKLGKLHNLELAKTLTIIAAIYIKLYWNRKTSVLEKRHSKLCEAYANASISLFKKLNIPDVDKEYLTARTTLADIGWKKAKQDDPILYTFESILKDLMNIKQKNHADDQSEIAEMHTILGGYYEKINDIDKVGEHYCKSLKLYRRLYGKNHTYVAISYSSLSNYYKKLGNLKKADYLISKAIDIVAILGQSEYINFFRSKQNEIEYLKN